VKNGSRRGFESPPESPDGVRDRHVDVSVAVERSDPLVVEGGAEPPARWSRHLPKLPASYAQANVVPGHLAAWTARTFTTTTLAPSATDQ